MTETRTDRQSHSCTCSTVPPSPCAMKAIPIPAPPKISTEIEHSQEEVSSHKTQAVESKRLQIISTRFLFLSFYKARKHVCLAQRVS